MTVELNFLEWTPRIEKPNYQRDGRMHADSYRGKWTSLREAYHKGRPTANMIMVMIIKGSSRDSLDLWN